MKTLDNVSIEDAAQKVSDIKVVGNGDLWKLLSKASSAEEGWMKSTKAMELPNGVGCVVQVTTQQRNIDLTYSVAEAVAYVPGVRIENDVNGGRKLVVAQS
jgi:hypothetical protein